MALLSELAILDDAKDVVIEIYCITCSVTNKQYIGQTVSHVLNHNKYRKYGTQKRFLSHISEAIKNTKQKQCWYLNNAIRKYGKESFSAELLYVCTKEDSDEEETKMIKEYNSLFPTGYNLKLGGTSFVHTNESKKILSNGVKKYFDDTRLLKYKDTSIPKDIDPDTLIKPLNRFNKQYGWYVYYNVNGFKIKADFGGVHLDLEESKTRARNFILHLQANDT